MKQVSSMTRRWRWLTTATVLLICGLVPPAAATIECSAALEPGEIRGGSGLTEVKVTLTADLSAVPEVVIEEGSGLRAGEIDLMDSRVLVVEIDASAANAGDWSLSLVTPDLTCTGTIKVITGPGITVPTE